MTEDEEIELDEIHEHVMRLENCDIDAEGSVTASFCQLEDLKPGELEEDKEENDTQIVFKEEPEPPKEEIKEPAGEPVAKRCYYCNKPTIGYPGQVARCESCQNFSDDL